jgi:hypothetical protein
VEVSVGINRVTMAEICNSGGIGRYQQSDNGRYMKQLSYK